MKSVFNPLFAFSLALLAGCTDYDPAPIRKGGRELHRIILQTDWYPQPEHGGFYHALINGYYEEAGLEVVINQGGPNALGPERIATGQAQFALTRSDDILYYSARKLPLLIVMAVMQIDPQAILLHDESPVRDWKDLDGKTIMATLGAAWIEVLQNRFHITFNTVPLDFGLERFITDKDFIQQCFITNEPYYMAKKGIKTRAMLIADSGFAPYRVVYTSYQFARDYPELVRAFVGASLRGWHDFLHGDPSRTKAYIASLNPKQTDDFMDYVIGVLKSRRIVEGRPERGEMLGLLDPKRFYEQIDDLIKIGMLKEAPPLDSVMTTKFLPPYLQEAAARSRPEAKPPSPPSELDPPPLTRTRQAESDLELKGAALGLAPGESRYLSYDAMMHLPTHSFSTDIVWENRKREVKALFLSDLMKALRLEGKSNLVLADCIDGYQSSYTSEVMEENEPFLVLEIEGKSPEVWGHVKGRNKYAHYINIKSEKNLIAPAHKKPFGANQLEFTDYKTKFKELYSGSFKNLDPKGQEGRTLYLESCASCHSPASRSFGGTLSSRTMEVLAIHARMSPSYFRAVALDPQSLLPGIKMGPNPFSDEELDSLIAFLKRVPMAD